MHFTLVASIAALVVLATAPQSLAVKEKVGMAIPISKRSKLVNDDKAVGIRELNSHVASVRAKILRGFKNYEKNQGVQHPSAVNTIGKRGAGDTLTDDESELWYGTISVGTPLKAFSVDFDTGSSDLFLPASTCDSSCKGHTLWDPISSSTSKSLGQNFLLEYGDGSAVSGKEYTDVVSITGFTARNQTLGAAEVYSSGFQLSNFSPDGLMGMGFQSISVYNASPPFQTLVSERQVTDLAFSFKLSSSGSELYIGGSNPRLYTGDFTYTPVTYQAYWQVEMENIQGDERTIFENVPVIIDTGTTVIVGLPAQVSKLHRALGGTPAQSVGKGFYSFPCKSFPTISLRFGGRSFQISPSALNLGPVSSGSSECVSGIVGQDTGASFWVLGDVFLQSVYTTFDVGRLRVGFAQLA